MSLRKRLAILSFLVVLQALALSPSLLAQLKDQAPRVQITGRVTDASGQPVEGLEVVLDASRRTFSFRRLEMKNRDHIPLATQTDAEGAFSLEWVKDRNYNHFDLQVGFYLRKGTEEQFEILHSTDIGRRVEDGGPVVLPVVLKSRILLDDYRKFVASVQTADEKRAFEAAGRPDRISRSDDGVHKSVKWWYFDAGKAYGFEDGVLVEVSDFDPVESFDGKDR